jgi:2-polyprenyl-6-methoxyphenol hydroxylase-like FAD-dependent oxidoreductase
MGAGRPRVLIAGAGPTGLTLALELARRGISCRIVDSDEPAPIHESRALAVNKRTLYLLGPSGVADAIRRDALGVREMRVYSRDRPVLTIKPVSNPDKEPMLRSLPQGHTERLLSAELTKFGVAPEWHTAFTGLIKNDQTGITATLKGPRGTEECEADFLAGADGAHSQVRKSLGLGFSGESLQQVFYISDFTYETDIESEFGEARFFNPGVIARIPVSNRTLRYVSTLENYRDLITHPAKIADVPWETTFKVSFRHAEAMQKGRAFLIGDAAHIHSPVGGRGMNLGIEDACWLAWLICEGREAEYSSLRMPAAKHVLRQTENNTRAILLANPAAIWLRNTFAPLAFNIPAFRDRMLRGVSGLDTPAAPWL